MNFRSTSSLLIVGLLAFLQHGKALAQERGALSASRLYTGASVGRGGYDTDFARTNATLFSTGATSFSGSAHSIDTMWKAYVGYQLSPKTSLEAGYWNLGKVDYSANITAPVTTSLQRQFKTDGYGLDAVFRAPLQGALSGVVRGGAMWTKAEASAADPGAGLGALPAESVSKLNSHWGMGLEYGFTRSAGVRVEVEYVPRVGDVSKFGTADVIFWSVGAKYHF